MYLREELYLFRYSLAKKGAKEAFRDAISNEKLPDDLLSRLCWDKTKRLLHYAYDKVPYYYQKFRSLGLHPLDINTPQQFSQVPVLTRDEVRENYNLLVSSETNIYKLKISTTGGSTGEPLKVGMRPGTAREIPKWQMLTWWGLQPGIDYASVYRKLPVSFGGKIAASLVSWPQKIISADASSLTWKEIEIFIQKFKRIKPQLLHGYVGAIDSIADYLIEKSIQLPSPKVIWVTASPVSAIQEEKIVRAFNAPVCDQYGCSEIYFISAECPKKEGLHVFSDSVNVEILDKNNNPLPSGETGKVVVTNLNEYYFPLLRYENGDEGKYISHKCSCGRSLPLMDKIKGRSSDNIILPDGTVLSGEYLTTIFDNFTEKVRQFQVIQRKTGKIEINVVISGSDRKGNPAIFNDLINDLNRKIRNQVPLVLKIVEHIENQRGKLQFIIKEEKCPGI